MRGHASNVFQAFGISAAGAIQMANHMMPTSATDQAMLGAYNKHSDSSSTPAATTPLQGVGPTPTSSTTPTPAGTPPSTPTPDHNYDSAPYAAANKSGTYIGDKESSGVIWDSTEKVADRQGTHEGFWD